MRKTLIVVLVALAASMACSSGTVKKPLDSDDRPPIIVTNGSIHFDDGDPNDKPRWKDWTQARSNSSNQWTQKYPTGPNVSSFTVDIAGSQNCAASTPNVLAVALEYTSSGDKSLVTVQRVLWSGGSGKKMEPWVSAPTDMSATSSGSAPPQLLYDPAGGYISNITLTTSGNPISCAFPANSTDVKITIQPVK
jgi:hypothetical protein